MTRSRHEAALYAAPTLPESLASIAIVAVIPGYYASTLGVSASWVGWALLASRCADAAIDPAVGYLSDITQMSRWGRKPMVLLGALVMASGAVCLLMPPSGVGARYLMLWSFVYFGGWTLYSVPYDAWGAELGSDRDGRARVFSWRAGFFYIGMAGFFVVPLLPWRSSHAIDAGVLTLNAEIVAVGVPALTLMACLWVPAGTMRPRAEPRESFLATARSVARNRPLVLYLINALISGLGNGMNVSLAYVYIADQLRLADSFSLILMANVLANLVALPPWRWVIHRFGKRYAWALGLLLNAATMPAFLFIPAGPRGFWPVLLLAALSGATYSVCNVTLPAILADVVDYETWRSRQVRTGSVFAAYALVRKFNSAVGSGAAFLLLAAFGYKPGTAAPGSTWGLMITFALIPTALQLVSAAMAANFPIDDRRHGVLRRWLARRTRQGHIASEVTCG